MSDYAKPTRDAIRRHGRKDCVAAYNALSDGSGAGLVKAMFGLRSVRTADALCDAGREIVTGKREP